MVRAKALPVWALLFSVLGLYLDFVSAVDYSKVFEEILACDAIAILAAVYMPKKTWRSIILLAMIGVMISYTLFEVGLRYFAGLRVFDN